MLVYVHIHIRFLRRHSRGGNFSHVVFFFSLIQWIRYVRYPANSGLRTSVYYSFCMTETMNIRFQLRLHYGTVRSYQIKMIPASHLRPIISTSTRFIIPDAWEAMIEQLSALHAVGLLFLFPPKYKSWYLFYHALRDNSPEFRFVIVSNKLFYLISVWVLVKGRLHTSLDI